MSLSSKINPFDENGVKWAKLQRFLRQAIDNAGISYNMSALLSDINTYDTNGVKWAKLGAWMELLANNIGGGGGGGAAAAGTLTGDTLAANVVTSSLTSFGAGAAVVTLTLTDAQIKALPTTAIDLVAAVPGKAFVAVTAVVKINATGGSYAAPEGSGTTTLLIYCGEGSGIFLQDTDVQWMLEDNTEQWLLVMGPRTADIAQAPFSEVAGQPLQIKLYPAVVGNLTGGNAANTLKVTVWYFVVDV